MVFFATVSSVAATAMLLPKAVHESRLLFSILKEKFDEFSNKVTMVIDEFDGQINNEIYEAVEIYLGNRLSGQKCRLKVSKTEEKKNFKVTLEHNEKVKDFYDGNKFKWVWLEFKCFDNPRDMNSILRSEGKCFKLTFHKKYMDLALHSYLPHIMKEAKVLRKY
ncbi:protein HYPER-SENSITIVITY-RELATED 4-like [Nicotiana tabacum]|uniref:Protein HYPER-SENSITIVITY-RELATED 4-like n=1 Tax=Nicotiana tabacum TaxID=4097 RepID=A0AC58SN26_TOBAC